MMRPVAVVSKKAIGAWNKRKKKRMEFYTYEVINYMYKPL